MKAVRMILAAVAVTGFLLFAVPLAFSVNLNIGNATGITVAVLLFLYAVFLPRVNETAKLFQKQSACTAIL